MNAQTRPHTYQINKEQVRIYSGDDRPGTLVSALQLQDDRYIRDSNTIPEQTYSHQYFIICWISFIRIAFEIHPEWNYSGYTLVQHECLSDAGMLQYLAIPAWKTWYDAEVAKKQ